jgi:hypothetical protein
MFEDRVDNLLDKANSKAKIKFKDASISIYGSDTN